MISNGIPNYARTQIFRTENIRICERVLESIIFHSWWSWPDRHLLRLGNTWFWMTWCFNIGLMSGGRSRGTNSLLIGWLKFIVATFKISWTTLYKNYLFKFYLNRKKMNYHSIPFWLWFKGHVMREMYRALVKIINYLVS